MVIVMILNQQGQFTFSRDLAKTTPNLGSHVLLVDDLADRKNFN